MTESTADVFAAYLGMTPENAGWAYGKRYFYDCRCGKDCCDTASEDEIPICSSCENLMQYAYSKSSLTATSPLAPAPTPGWASVLLRWRLFNLIQVYHKSDGKHFEACVAPECELFDAMTPEAAMCYAMMDADPALRARLEACGDCEGVK